MLGGESSGPKPTWTRLLVWYHRSYCGDCPVQAASMSGLPEPTMVTLGALPSGPSPRL
jgi:hypothetical protein